MGDASFNDVSNGNFVITPTQYLITETIIDVNGATVDTTSVDLSNLALNNLTPTSFDSELLNFYARAISASETNNVVGGIFVPSKINATDINEFLRVKNSEQVATITDPTSSTTILRFDFDNSSKQLANS